MEIKTFFGPIAEACALANEYLGCPTFDATELTGAAEADLGSSGWLMCISIARPTPGHVTYKLALVYPPEDPAQTAELEAVYRMLNEDALRAEVAAGAAA